MAKEGVGSRPDSPSDGECVTEVIECPGRFHPVLRVSVCAAFFFAKRRRCSAADRSHASYTVIPHSGERKPVRLTTYAPGDVTLFLHLNTLIDPKNHKSRRPPCKAVLQRSPNG